MTVIAPQGFEITCDGTVANFYKDLGGGNMSGGMREAMRLLGNALAKKKIK